MKINEVKVEVWIAEEYINSLREQLHEHGFLQHANQDNVLFYTKCKDYTRSLDFVSLDMPSSESISPQTSCKVEFHCMIHQVKKVKKIIHDIHPSDHPIIYFIPIME